MAESQVHASIPERKRCAVYTRVSVDDARHEPFGSTDAQFMACHELIASQQGLGWQPSSRLYEHRGYSASHLRRPGIQMLLDDVQSGLVDVVVVHRLDRLTRHVGDMQTLMSVFEQHGVALVCVTLSLDTSSSHGRLALHLWTSFAQFERELIGERIRDKRAAAKRRGLWHGSAAPLGYVLVQQRLVIEPQEASIVRDMFTRFAAQSSVITLLQELDDGVVASGTDMQRMSARPMALALETATYHPFPSNDGYDITLSFCKSYLLLGLRLERLICQ